MFGNITPQIAVNLDYTILEQVCTVWKHDGNKNNFKKTIEAQILQKLMNNKPRSKLADSY